MGARGRVYVAAAVAPVGSTTVDLSIAALTGHFSKGKCLSLESFELLHSSRLSLAPRESRSAKIRLVAQPRGVRGPTSSCSQGSTLCAGLTRERLASRIQCRSAQDSDGLRRGTTGRCVLVKQGSSVFQRTLSAWFAGAGLESRTVSIAHGSSSLISRARRPSPAAPCPPRSEDNSSPPRG